jgi:hypothetical protein
VSRALGQSSVTTINTYLHADKTQVVDTFVQFQQADVTTADTETQLEDDGGTRQLSSSVWRGFFENPLIGPFRRHR